MAATLWWFCGECGFKNHPRSSKLHHGNKEINESCEQCGDARSNGTDYKPEA